MQDKNLSLYKDMRDLPSEQLTGESKATLDTYVADLKTKLEACKKEINNNPQKDWFYAAKEFLVTLISNTFEDYGVDLSKLRFQFYICGSLAKEQATPYSDFDGFIIWEDPKEDRVKQAELLKIKDALKGMNWLFQRIFDLTNQFCPDPIGITPFSYQGTPEELYLKIAKDEVADTTSFINSISSAKPLLLDTGLLNELCNKIADNPRSKEMSLQRLYSKVVHDFAGPKSKASINIKKDIFRPLDFILSALRKEYSIHFDDNSHLVLVKTIEELVKRGIFSHELGDFLLSIFRDAIHLRFITHIRAKKEKDTIKLADLKGEQPIFVRNLIDKVAILRGIAHERLLMLEKGEKISDQRIELTSICNVPYKSQSYSREEMRLDLSPYLFDNPVRQYFEKNQSIIKQNLLKVDFTIEGGVETIFKNFKNIPTHLNYLSITLSECFEGFDQEAEQDSENLKLNLDKFNEWCRVLYITAFGDLFDSDGQLYPWIKKIINLDNKSPIEANKIKQSLLQAYVANLIREFTAINPAIKTLLDETFQEISHNINSEMRLALNSMENFTFTEISDTQEHHYQSAINNLAEVISKGIALLQNIKNKTSNKNEIHIIEQRIAKYENLWLDLSTVNSNQKGSSASKSYFFTKAYHYFSNDFHQFEQEFKTQNRSLWVKFKEALASVKSSLHAVVTHTKKSYINFTNRKKKITEFLTSSEQKIQLFSKVIVSKSQDGSDTIIPNQNQFNTETKVLVQEESEKLYPTFEDYLAKENNSNKHFDDYLVDYFKERAAPYIIRFLNDSSQLGLLSRITNDLTTIHPKLNQDQIINSFISAVNSIADTELAYKADVLKRWFYASVNIVTKLFLDKDDKIKAKFLAAIVDNNLNTLEAVKTALYGNPEDPKRVKSVANQVLGSAAVALTSILAASERIQKNEIYLNRICGMPIDDIPHVQSLCKTIDVNVLDDFITNDFYLCRIKLVQELNMALININTTLPEHDKIKTLASDLNSMYDQLVLKSPIAGTSEYNQLFSAYLGLVTKIQDQLKKHPRIKDIVSDIVDEFFICFSELRVTTDRGSRLSLFSDTLNQFISRTSSEKYHP